MLLLKKKKKEKEPTVRKYLITAWKYSHKERKQKSIKYSVNLIKKSLARTYAGNLKISKFKLETRQFFF